MDVIERCKWFNFAEPEFGRKLLIALLGVAAEQDGVCGKRAAAALEGVPRIGGYMRMKDHRWFRQAPSLHDRISNWLHATELPGSMMEWVWEGGPIAIAARVDVEPRRYDDRASLERCMRTLKRQNMPVHGLLIVTKELRGPENLPDPGHEQFLGMILWRDAEERLRAIRPGSDLSCEEWDDLLDDLCSLEAEGA